MTPTVLTNCIARRPLFRRVRAYYRHYYEKKTALDEADILNELSPNLRREVGLFLVDTTRVIWFQVLTAERHTSKRAAASSFGV